jgi:hypothetical protein
MERLRLNRERWAFFYLLIGCLSLAYLDQNIIDSLIIAFSFFMSGWIARRNLVTNEYKYIYFS